MLQQTIHANIRKSTLVGEANLPQLTRRQEAILNFIRKNVEEKGYPPSVREIGEAVGLASSSTVHGHLERLQQKGFLRRDPTKPRALELLDTETRHVPHTHAEEHVKFAPVIGRVTAGQPISAFENIEGYLPIPKTMAPDNNVFVLEVQGESMIDAGILNGDFVIVRRQNTALNGEIVVAMTDEDEATVKRFYKEKNHIRLQPENETMEPFIYPDVHVLGKVIGVFRQLH